MSYKRQIKFFYYKVRLFTKVDGKETWGDFDLTDWIADVKNNGKMHKNIELSDTKVNFEDLYHYPQEELYVFRVYKLRDSNVPSIVKDGGPVEPIDLEDDEYIGEDMTILYDWKNRICMSQQNRMSVGTTRLSEWINKDIGFDESKKVVFVPISGEFTIGRLKNHYVRSIEFSFANMKPADADGPLKSIISSFEKYEYLNGRITISVGRAKDAQLKAQATEDLIRDIQSNSGMVGSAKAKLKSMSDDDKSRTEIVDLFDVSSHDYIEFEIEAKKPLAFDQARAKMYSTYMKRRNDIVRLSGSKS